MAQTNYTPIQLYYSTTAAAVPVNTNLLNGELAINITDGKLYYKDNSGTVQVIATKGAGTIGGSTTQIQYNNAGALAGSSAMTFNNSTNVVTLTTLNLTNALGAIYGGTGLSTYTTGDLLYSSASNTLAKLAIGTANYILTVNSGGTNVQWSAPSSISVSTATNLAGGAAGSVPYQSAAATTTFLAIGAADRVMTSSGSAPQWVTSLTSLTGVSSSSITNTSLTSGRVVYSGASGVQTDSANLTFNGTTLTTTGLSNSGTSALVRLVTVGDTSFNGATVFAAATPAKLYMGTGTATDTTSAIGATNAVGAVASLAITPIAATNTSVTYTDAATLYIAGAPSAGTNITLTNPYALYIAAGNVYLGGGTANGVAYLNGSKVLTTGSALTFDGTKFTVGIGSTFSDAIADFYQDTNATRYVYARNPNAGAAAAVVFNANAGGGGDLRMTAYGSGHSTLANHASLFNHKLNGQLLFGVEGSERMRLTSTGLGIGTTSPQATIVAAGSNATVYKAMILRNGNGTDGSSATIDFETSAGTQGSEAAMAGRIAGVRTGAGTSGALTFSTTNGGVLGERARINSSGNLLVGITSNNPGSPKVSVEGSIQPSWGQFRVATVFDNSFRQGLYFDSTARNMTIFSTTSDSGGNILFSTRNAVGSSDADYGTERARITSGGYLKVSNSGTYQNVSATFHEINNSTDNTEILFLRSMATSNPYGMTIYWNSASPNDTTRYFLRCDDSTAQRFTARSNGGLANYSANDVNLSDRREKTNFAPAKSYLDVICAIPVQTFNYIDQNLEEDPGLTLGVVAQDVQAVAPELVMESNWANKDEEPKMRLSIYQTDLQYALMKCIQEQQALITQLTARITALEGA